MVHESVGNVPAPSFFAIDQSTGAISVIANRKEDDDFECNVRTTPSSADVMTNLTVDFSFGLLLMTSPT